MEHFKPVKATGLEVVVQDNRLVDSPRFLSLQEQKLFIFLVSKLNPETPDDITFRIPVTEYAKAVGIDLDNAYREVRKIVKRLMSRVISIFQYEDGCRTETMIPVLSYYKYWESKGYADVRLAKELVPYLFDLNKRYTQYKLTQITGLSSIYAIRIYEILKRNEGLKVRKLFIDDLKKILAIPPKQYKRFNDFKRKVLDIAQKEINAKTDLIIEYQLTKVGKKFEVIAFSMTPKNSSEKPYITYESPSISREKVIEKLRELNVPKKMANEWCNRYSLCTIEDAIQIVQKQLEKGQCKNQVGMLRTAIQKKWKPSTNDKKNNPQEKEKSTETKASKLDKTGKKTQSKFIKILNFLSRKD
jgi:plasmid replication initiation protein